MKNYGLASVAEFLDDFVVYRNLVPMDPGLPSLDALRGALDLTESVTPRKSEPDYGRVMVQLLKQARALDAPGAEIKRLVYVGDTRLNDGTAFANACRAGGWPGIAFIGSEKGDAPQVEIVEQDGQTLYLANRWSMLADFDAYCAENGFPLDAETAVILDLDKTTVGARGRNDHVINTARVAAVRRTVGDLLGNAFDPVSFQEAYDLLNQTQFHPFTTDNRRSLMGLKPGEKGAVSTSLKDGGDQIEYEEQDPRIHRIWLQEMKNNNVVPQMEKWVPTPADAAE